MQYDTDVMRKVCEQVVEGASILEICKQPGFPSFATLVNWVRTNDEAASLMDNSRIAMQMRMAETLRHIGENIPDSKLEAAANRLHSDNLRWLLEREYSEKYGNKVQVDHSGEINLRMAVSMAKQRLADSAMPIIDVPTELPKPNDVPMDLALKYAHVDPMSEEGDLV